MPLDHAALIEPITVAVHALSRFGSVSGLNVLVLGAGTIGNLVAQVAVAAGAKKVMPTDISEYKLEKARQCGLNEVVNPEKQDLSKEIMKNFGSNKADLILECVGVQDTINQAIANARKGSTIIVVGVFGDKPRVDLGLVEDRELSLIGTLMYQRNDYARAIEFVSNGKLHLDQMVNTVLRLRIIWMRIKPSNLAGENT